MNVSEMFDTYTVLKLKKSYDNPHEHEFREGDIAYVEYIHTENHVKDTRSCLGMIEYIDTSFIEIDCSERFKKKVVTINFDTIEYIEHRFIE